MRLAKKKIGQCPPEIVAKYGEGVNSWDAQIRLFARYFLRHARLPKEQFTLLDVGCGTGSALSEIHQRYPNAQLSGCDLESAHVEISSTMNGEIATFFQGDVATLNVEADIFYVSNVLEHVPEWPKVATDLLTRCKRLYVMVPYRETVKGEQLCSEMGLEHRNYFTENSFDFLKAKDIDLEWRVLRTPYAWGHPLIREYRLRALQWFRGERFDLQRQLLISITKSDYVFSGMFRELAPFRSPLAAWNKSLRSID